MSGIPPSKKVEFYPLDGGGNRTSRVITAQFNPTQLQYTITNTAARGSGSQRTQRVDESSAKLNLELVFDTTDSGSDVRVKTQEIAALMERNPQTKVPPKVEVAWGAFKFTGIFDSYRETLDFFSEDGIPLRATLSVTMSSPAEANTVPREVFHFAQGGSAAAFNASARGELGSPDERVVETRVRSGFSASETAQAAGDPGRGRAISSFNGVEDMRNPAGETDTLLVPEDEPELLDAVAFASGGLGGGLSAGAGAGFSAGAGAGFSAGAGAGFSAGASAGFSAGASAGFSAGASAGFSAGASAGFSAGASAGFSAGASAGFSAGASAGFSAGASAGFSAGASAGFSAGASAGFSAGASAGFSAGAGAGFSAGVGSSFSAGAGAGFSAGAGSSFSAGASAGFSAGAGAGFSAGASASAFAGSSGFAGAAFSADAGGSFSSGPVAGGRASAGVSASAGAFAFVGASAAPPRRPMEPSRLIVETETVHLETSAGAQYAVGGRVVGEASGGYRAQVGQGTSLAGRITFEED